MTPPTNKKSAGAFKTIGEVSSAIGVQQHVLRFWESKFSQIKPLKRGGGRRYYRPEDVDLIKNIYTLLYDEGYTIKGVQKMLREGGGKIDVAQKDAATAIKSAAGKLTDEQVSSLQTVLSDLYRLKDTVDNF